MAEVPSSEPWSAGREPSGGLQTGPQPTAAPGVPLTSGGRTYGEEIAATGAARMHERIVSAAYDLFARRGVRDVGINELISSSGVAKLIRARCFLPLNASSARRVTSAFELTSNVTVFIVAASNSRRPPRSLTRASRSR